MTTSSDTEQTPRRPRLLAAARRIVELAREQRPIGEAIDHLSSVLATDEGAVCRECLHSETSRVNAACIRERELIVAFLRRCGAYELANRVAADHHVILHDGRGKPLSASAPPLPWSRPCVDCGTPSPVMVSPSPLCPMCAPKHQHVYGIGVPPRPCRCGHNP